MFNTIRNNKKIIQLVLAIIILPFALWGVDSYVRNTGGADIATVGDTPIAQEEFQRALSEQQDRLRPQVGGNTAILESPEFRNGVLQELINRRLLLLYANKSQMGVSNETLSGFISSLPALQVDGKFSRAQYEALVAAEALSRRGVETRVLNMHTVKPLDVKALVAAAKQTGAIVTLEEAQAAGGLGGAVCETLAAYAPVPVERVGMPDRFGESGEPTELLEAFGLTAPYVALAVERVLARKRGEKVPDRPEHVAAAERRLAELQEQIMSQALARTPRKWGGKKPDATLKSRSKKPA